MSAVSLADAWVDSPWGALFLLLALVLVALDLGRAATHQLTVAVGAVRLGAPALVPLTSAETATAAQLLGGAIADYLAETDGESEA